MDQVGCRMLMLGGMTIWIGNRIAWKMALRVDRARRPEAAAQSEEEEGFDGSRAL